MMKSDSSEHVKAAHQVWKKHLLFLLWMKALRGEKISLDLLYIKRNIIWMNQKWFLLSSKWNRLAATANSCL